MQDVSPADDKVVSDMSMSSLYFNKGKGSLSISSCVDVPNLLTLCILLSSVIEESIKGLNTKSKAVVIEYLHSVLSDPLDAATVTLVAHEFSEAQLIKKASEPSSVSIQEVN
jgi:hypothetical protein